MIFTDLLSAAGVLDFAELLSWAFLEDAINSREEKLSLAVQESARRGILVCLQRILLVESGQKHRHERTWLLLQSCARSVVILVAASLSQHAETLLHEEWIGPADTGIHVLRQWVAESDGVRNQVQALEELRELQQLRKMLGC